LKITYLIPKPSSEGGMTAITKMFYEINYFDNINTFHFNTSFTAQGKWGRFIELFSKQFRFIQHLIKAKPDVIFVMSNSYFGFFDKCIYCLVARLFGVKSMLNHVGGEFDKFYHTNALIKGLVNLFIRFPHVLLIGSSFWCNYFKEKFPFKIVHNSPNPIIVEQYAKTTEPHPEAKFKIASLFRIVKEKGVLELIEVIKRVTTVQKNVEFVIMGGGPMLNYLKEQLHDEVEKKNVNILGFVDDDVKIKEMSSSDLYVMLTHFDLMPISIMEAMAAGMPVLSTKVGGIPDLVQQGVNGYLYEIGEVEQVVEKILELAEPNSAAKRMGAKGREMVTENFDIYSVIKIHRNIASDLLLKS
jgi:glycosyltransferase involved in cell wall biosynthesis